ncbi:HNH endonuclease [Bradyrhizobium sp. S69]|uniref:HNH endonuclease n=1 Tax=Bradyrhizobium sp. S69 TaxID=1641856 RepID=UPI00131BF017|nr:HNH endonuclease [Bradyrhizobium sp. S69]
MSISEKTIKLLWANAAGRCAFPDCAALLCLPESGTAAPYTIGEMAHIRGEKKGANRHDSAQASKERDGYANLILLCPTHHTLIDKPENEAAFTVNSLLNMKLQHNADVENRFKSKIFANKQEVANTIHPLLAQNKAVFKNYGPRSEIARKNPESDAHAAWLSMRLSTIVPNNRRIAELTSKNANLFSADEQNTLAEFEVHASGYEKWVNNETSYEGVVRFPASFETLIQELAK